jgi:hypothetical protein
MPRICYIEKVFTPDHRRLIALANKIIEDYKGQGFDLTLRQLYYQMVARDVIDNTQQSYKRLGTVLNDARLAGMIDWDDITDRTRMLRGVQHWNNPAEIIRSASTSYQVDKWADQKYRVEVWVEKDALVGVIGSACASLDVDYFSCRGYTSSSEMWIASQRLQGYASAGQVPVILHFGDHDPSGRDMTRDIIDRLKLFMGGVDVNRLALNMNQIEQYKPPPNPAKITDSRAVAYIKEFGNDSWELDALEPAVLVDLVKTNVMAVREEDKWTAAMQQQERERQVLSATSEHWAPVSQHVIKRYLTPKPPRKKPTKRKTTKKPSKKKKAHPR